MLPEMSLATAPNLWLVGPYRQYSVVLLVECSLIGIACGSGAAFL